MNTTDTAAVTEELDAKLDKIEQWLADMGGITSDAYARTISEARAYLAAAAIPAAPALSRKGGAK